MSNHIQTKHDPRRAYADHIEAVRQATDIVELVGEHVKLERTSGSFKGLSPFNAERTPSFFVCPTRQRWTDFSGGQQGAGGSCFDFVMRLMNFDFKDAVSFLADRKGVPAPNMDPEAAAEAKRFAAERRRMEELLTAAVAFWHGKLSLEVRQQWLRERYGFTDETIDELQIGYAGGGLLDHLRTACNATDEQLLACGLAKRDEHGRLKQRFWKRIIFPYWRRGNVVYLSGRRDSDQPDTKRPKYYCLPTRSDKNPDISEAITNGWFFNEDAAYDAGPLLLTEGITDCVAAAQAGYRTIGLCTTSVSHHNQERLAKIAARAKSVTICFDNDDSDAGLEGAISVAGTLADAGVTARIIRLPRPDGQKKVDLNAYLSEHGPEAFAALHSEAADYLSVMIERIPATAEGKELAEALEPVLQRLAARSQVEADVTLRDIKARWKIPMASLRKDLKQVDRSLKAKPTTRQRDRSDRAPRLRGAVVQGNGFYGVVHGKEDEVDRISSFTIHPKRKIFLPEDEIIEADCRTHFGTEIRGVKFRRKDWNKRERFVDALSDPSLHWTGNNDNVQGVLELVSQQPMEVIKGVTSLGYLEEGGIPLWVAPEATLTPLGWEGEAPSIALVDAHQSMSSRLAYPIGRPEVVDAVARAVLDDLLRVNTPEVVLPALGWFFAAPLRPRFQQLEGQFPMLMMWGTQGSGKTSLVKQVLLPLLGFCNGEPYSATQTTFTLVRVLSASSSIPVFLDEYRPSDMDPKKVSDLNRLIRRGYGIESEERGRGDQSVEEYRLSAPLVLVGESPPTDPAIIERMLCIRAAKPSIGAGSSHTAAYERVVGSKLGLLAAPIIRALLATDTTEALAQAKVTLLRLTGGRNLKPRIAVNLAIMLVGLQNFQAVRKALGMPPAVLDLEAAAKAVLAELQEDGRESPKNAFDHFLESLSTLTIVGDVKAGVHFQHLKSHRLAIHIPTSHHALELQAARVRDTSKLSTLIQLRNTAREMQQTGSYIEDVSSNTYFDHSARRKAVIIDLLKAAQHIDIEGLMPPKVSESPTPPSHETPVCVSVAGRTGGDRKESHQ